MSLTIAEMLANAKGGPIDYNGKSIVMSYKIPITMSQEVELEFIRVNDKYQQGVEISIDIMEGFIEVNGQKLNSPVFWTATAPKLFTFKCNPLKKKGLLNIWNVWRSVEHNDIVDAWTGNSGIYIEHKNDNEYLFYCSCGRGDVNFNDLVFRLRIE